MAARTARLRHERRETSDLLGLIISLADTFFGRGKFGRKFLSEKDVQDDSRAMKNDTGGVNLEGQAASPRDRGIVS